MTAAYLASALTGLDDAARRSVFAVSDLVSAACVERGIDLYEPRASTDPVHHPDVNDRVVYLTDQARVLSSDLVILLADEPSTGAGQELTMAVQAMIPVLVVAHEGRQVSRMITGSLSQADAVVRYSDLSSLAVQLPPSLDAIMSSDRRSAARKGIGSALLRHRLAANLTQADLCAAVAGGGAFDVQYVGFLETSEGRAANPSLAEIQALAAALNVPPSSLLDS